MTSRSIIRASRLLQFLALLNILAVSSTGVAVGEATRTDLGVEVKLWLNDLAILAGEPVYLNVTISLKGDPEKKGIFTSKLALSEGNDVEVYVQPQGELEARYEGAAGAGISNDVTLEVTHGKPRTYSFRLQHDPDNSSNGYLFPKAGEYQVRGRLTYTLFHNSQNRLNLEIPPTTVTVSEPAGADASAFALVNNAGCAKALHTDRVESTEVMQKLRKVAADFPDTVYGRNSQITIGMELAHGNKTDNEGALKILVPLMSKIQSHPAADRVAYTNAVANHMLGRYEKAREWIYYLVRAYPDSVLVRPQLILLSYYYFTPAVAASTGPWYLAEVPWTVQGAKLPKSLAESPQS